MNTASDAIEDDRGLYFINAQEKIPINLHRFGLKEPESNSVWFPTIDKPNDAVLRSFVTVDNRFVTLSDSLLVNSKENGDGTRTIVETRSAAYPYLFMLSIGDYAVVKDTWRDIDVHYFVEHEYEDNARGIFKNTPEMLEFSRCFCVMTFLGTNTIRLQYVILSPGQWKTHQHHLLEILFSKQPENNWMETSRILSLMSFSIIGLGT